MRAGGPGNPYQHLHFGEYAKDGRRLEGWRPSRSEVVPNSEFAVASPPVPENEDGDFKLWYDLCRQEIGRDLERISYPGGFTRDAIRLHFTDRSSLIGLTRWQRYARLEVYALRQLRAAGALVPKVLWYRGMMAITEDFQGPRLSEAINEVAEDQAWLWVERAVQSLSKLHDCGSHAGLDRDLPKIGLKKVWLKRVSQQPRMIGEALGLAAPEYDAARLAEKLSAIEPQFARWDARPGNAIAMAGDRVAWFDFEASGCRSRLDDLVWLLADEIVPDVEAREDQLLDDYFANTPTNQDRDYFYTMGVIHSLMRLGYILSEKGEGAWSSIERQLDTDRVMIDWRVHFRLCMRAARWASRSTLLAPLSTWLADLAINAPDAD